MRTKSTEELIEMAQAVLVSLIESHKVIEPCEVEGNLIAINSLLIDASISSSRKSVPTKENNKPEQAIAMLEIIATDTLKNTSLLEFIYRNSNRNSEIDCAIACLIRSMQKNPDATNEFIRTLSEPPESDKNLK